MSLYYEDDYVQLHHGDCRAVRGWTLADVLVTDPPYGIGWTKGENKRAKSKAHAGIANDHDTSARDAALAQWGNRPYAVFGSWRAPFPAHKQVLVWQKPVDTGIVGATTGFRNDTELIFLGGALPIMPPSRSSVLQTTVGQRSYTTGEHPHVKPLSLMMSLIDAMPSGLIADPFAGSGSTLIAARNLGRKAIGVEIDERYCELIVKRLSQQAFDFSALVSHSSNPEPTP